MQVDKPTSVQLQITKQRGRLRATLAWKLVAKGGAAPDFPGLRDCLLLLLLGGAFFSLNVLVQNYGGDPPTCLTLHSSPLLG